MSGVYLCGSCGHFVTDHRMDPATGDLVAGPYTCRVRNCECSIRQNSPTIHRSTSDWVNGRLDHIERAS
jgi:hypothetical protein